MPLRRLRERQVPGLPAPDAELEHLVQCLHTTTTVEQGTVLQALHRLCALTVWQEQNQRQAVQLGAVPLVLLQLRANGPACHWHRSSPPPADASAHHTTLAQPGEEDAPTLLCVRALSLLCNLSNNEDLAHQVAAGISSCVPVLVALMATAAGASQHQVTVLAARCLINLTQFSQAGQEEALQVIAVLHQL